MRFTDEHAAELDGALRAAVNLEHLRIEIGTPPPVASGVVSSATPIDAGHMGPVGMRSLCRLVSARRLPNLHTLHLELGGGQAGGDLPNNISCYPVPKEKSVTSERQPGIGPSPSAVRCLLQRLRFEDDAEDYRAVSSKKNGVGELRQLTLMPLRGEEAGQGIQTQQVPLRPMPSILGHCVAFADPR